MFDYKIDVLNLEWPQSERDRHIITPVYLYLREKYKLIVKSESVFNGYFYLLKYRPKLLVISNSVGADINFSISKTAYQMGIKTVSLISEGNIVAEEQIDEFFWGWNKEKILYEDGKILWSSRSKDVFLKKYPELSNKLYVSGGTGFDRYRLCKFIDKESFLLKNNLGDHKKIIGIAGWAFDIFFTKERLEFYKSLFTESFNDERIFEIHRNNLFLVREIYRKLIKENKDTFFILRYHPRVMNFEKTEFWGLENFENVYVSNPAKQQNNDDISDLINTSDLWIGYSSTTLLEAWLLGKTTFLINPTSPDFIRDNICKGSPITSNYPEAQEFIEAFFENGKIEEFEALKNMRKKIIKDVIEYDDGKNHIRAAEIIYKIFSEKNERTKRIKYNNFPLVAMLKQFLSFELDKFFKRRNYDIDSEINHYESLYLPVIKNEISENGK